MVNQKTLSDISRRYGSIIQSNLSGRETMSIETCEEKCYEYINSVLESADSNDDKASRLALLKSLIGKFVIEQTPVVSNFVVDGIMSNAKLEEHLIHKITEFDILTNALYDDAVDEIQLNNHTTIFVEKGGVKELYTDADGTPLMFKNPDEVYKIIQKLLGFSKSRISPKNPMVSTTTSLGYRVSATHGDICGKDLPPYNLAEHTMVIRKVKPGRFSDKDFIAMKVCSTKMFLLLSLLGMCRFSVISAGETGSGKSTLLDLICKKIPMENRTFMMQNPTEVRISQRDSIGRVLNNIVQLEVKDVDNPKSTDPTYKNATMQAFRYTPETIFYGELRRDSEFMIALLAATSGHNIITSMHAGGPRQAVKRYTNEVKAATGGDSETILENICDNIQIVVTMRRYIDGSRKLADISEIVGTELIDGMLQPKIVPIFQFIKDVEEVGVANIKEIDLSTVRKKVVNGCHYQVGYLSEKSIRRMTDNGIPESVANIFSKAEFEKNSSTQSRVKDDYDQTIATRGA